MRSFIPVLLFLFAVSSLHANEDSMEMEHHPASKPATEVKREKKKEFKGDLWPLATCPVSGEVIGEMGDPVILLHEGREVRFCCEGCIEDFKADPAKFLAKADKKIIEEQKRSYPAKVCLVSGEELGSMGDPVDVVIKNRLFRFCCAGCVPKVEKDPEKYFKKLNAAVVEKQRASYPLDVCVVSGEKLGEMGEPQEIVQANQLVRLCCEGCIKAFKKNPAEYMKKIDSARKEKTVTEAPAEEVEE